VFYFFVVCSARPPTYPRSSLLAYLVAWLSCRWVSLATSTLALKLTSVGLPRHSLGLSRWPRLRLPRLISSSLSFDSLASFRQPCVCVNLVLPIASSYRMLLPPPPYTYIIIVYLPRNTMSPSYLRAKLIAFFFHGTFCPPDLCLFVPGLVCVIEIA